MDIFFHQQLFQYYGNLQTAGKQKSIDNVSNKNSIESYFIIDKEKENNENNENNENIITELIKPTKIYNEVFDICNKYEKNILGLAHITGGGFYDNIMRILPNDLEFELFDWEFPYIFKWIQEKSNLSKKEMLNIFNCGYGMVIISNKELNITDIDLIGYIKNKK